MSDQLHIHEFGNADGTPIVCLHGFGGLGSGWVVLPALVGPSMRVIAPDMPGHGQSLEHPAAGNVAAMADAVLRETDRLGLDQFYLCGHSMGGAVASLLALKRPNAVRSMVLIAPGGYGPGVNQDLLNDFASAETKEEVRRSLEGIYFPGKGPVPAAVDILHEEHARPGVIASLQRIAMKLFGSGKLDLLPINEIGALDIPIHVIWGLQDNVVPAKNGKTLPAGFTVHFLDEVNHVPHEEAPKEVRDVLKLALGLH